MVKKGELIEIIVNDIQFPNKGMAYIDNKTVIINNSLPGQRLLVKIKRKRKDKMDAIIINKIQNAPHEIQAPCRVFYECGGCTYQHLSYENQIRLKEKFVLDILKPLKIENAFQGVQGSKNIFEYRNKMEFSFGNSMKDGPLTLGLHKRGSIYDIVDAGVCILVDEDYRKILAAVLQFAQDHSYSFYYKKTHEGLLRHLVVRKGIRTGEILINLITSSQGIVDHTAYVNILRALDLTGEIKGIIHTVNDSLADIVQEDTAEILMGRDYIYDILFDLTFKITPYSFFQTNTEGAMQLYDVIKNFVGSEKHDTIYDLYCGTGTIAQVLAKRARKVVGIEIVEEAVIAAKENAKRNGLDNCEFIAEDVLQLVDTLEQHPDLIILDPPRDGIHPKAIKKILAFQPKTFIYVSCKPTSLARDLPYFINAGYEIKKIKCVDMFPQTSHVECVVLMSRVKE
ncbi:MAG: 23S rRNA (uracil(1939)-C(5))-methyltransferase RlmD [Eubacteriales bacterium]